MIEPPNDFYSDAPRHHIIDSINFVSSGIGEAQVKRRMLPAEWASYLGFPGHSRPYRTTFAGHGACRLDESEYRACAVSVSGTPASRGRGC